MSRANRPGRIVFWLGNKFRTLGVKLGYRALKIIRLENNGRVILGGRIGWKILRPDRCGHQIAFEQRQKRPIPRFEVGVTPAGLAPNGFQADHVSVEPKTGIEILDK